MKRSRLIPSLQYPLVILVLLVALVAPGIASAQTCARNLTANVVALDQVIFYNRLGTVAPGGMIFALKRDVVDRATGQSCTVAACTEGNVELRPGKRPRPMVLRMNAGDCLTIHFSNLLDPVRRDLEQPATRTAGINVIGLQPVVRINDNGENVGANGLGGSGLVAPGGSISYTLYAEREGQHLLYSPAATTGGEGNGGSLAFGLFGAVHVEPAGSSWFRSQVTAADLVAASTGTAPTGQPVLDYGASFPDGTPVLAILQGTEIVHSDLTAIIVPQPGTYPANPVYPNRDQPFREFTITYHDEIAVVQAFPALFRDPVLRHTLHSVRDGFAFNYGTGGIGAEIIANRVGVGPMRDCVGCKYEEFFLTSYAVGDPAMVVDVPANACVGNPACRATQAMFPDDPSNVYHGYLRDHVKFRILHAGPKEHHIHHQHTHQWVYAPDSDESAYLDSQALGPGAGFTLEMTYNGSGNRNQAVGDSIFHCHFYPHFAQGMWALWRVHDVFEDGSRMLPDGEIVQGTPIPALVPLPGLPMAPLPGAAVQIAVDPNLPNRGGQMQVATNNGFKFVYELGPTDVVAGNPGYPFWVPAAAGSRPPHPPLDTIHDGGLPRHILLDGEAVHVETRLDFTKEIEGADAVAIAETGNPVEQVAMDFHGGADLDGDGSTRTIPSSVVSLTGAVSAGNFIVNGRPPAPGAPYAEPCVDDDGNPVGVPREYRAANIQLDVVFNKSGWHFPQQRIITLWGDVQDTFDGVRAPEPFFFRAHTNDCISFFTTNLVPSIYEMDDFQVRTPTDILGQHIHLVKFDVLASDGAANGFNYEDGTFSPDEVIERIHAINAHGGLNGQILAPTLHPFPDFQRPEFLGAQITVQRWYADDVLNLAGKDRTLRTVFTHDHYGPSTHQQAGLYAGLVVEPAGSTWRDPETGQVFGGRFDGGPTSWRADILTVNPAESYREFLLEYADFQLAYEQGGGFTPATGAGTGPVFPLPWACNPDPSGACTGDRQPGQGFDDRAASVNPPAKKEVFPDLLIKAPLCPGGVVPPCPEAISADEPGTFVVNYRNEPVPLRVRDPLTNQQAAGDPGDLSLVYSSSVTRIDPVLNDPPALWPYGIQTATTGAQTGDPFTPILRAYDNDRVQIRTLVGAHEEGHNFAIHGLKWMFEPSWKDSGWRGAQMAGISEHFEFVAPLTPAKGARGPFSDYLYMAGAASDNQWNGNWGILRSHRNSQGNLLPLPNNPAGGPSIGNPGAFHGVCPTTAPTTTFDITAIPAADIPGGRVVYNSRVGAAGTGFPGPLNDPTAILFVHSSDLDNQGNLPAGVPIEPLILRANAGDCVEVILRNNLPVNGFDLPGFNTMPMIVEGLNANDVVVSSHVGLHAQLVALDVTTDDGAAVGFNNRNNLTAPQGNQKDRYSWYAGDLRRDPATGDLVATPIEFGAVNLTSSDRIKHSNKGAIAALIIEPAGASWTEDAGTRASATVCPGGEVPCSMAGTDAFREFVVAFQTDVNLRDDAGNPIPNTFDAEDPEDSGQKALNYRTEPAWFRIGFAPDTPGSPPGATSGCQNGTRDCDFTDLLTNALVGGDPETPVFTATAGDPVRFRVLDPGGHARNSVFTAHGHVWQQEPYVTDPSALTNPLGVGSTSLGDNPRSMWEGSRMGHGPMMHFDALLQHGAGGAFGVAGDYLYRDQASFQFSGGVWGLLRVNAVPVVAEPVPAPSPIPTDPCPKGSICTTETTGVAVE